MIKELPYKGGCFCGKVKDENLKKILQEIAELLRNVYGERLRAVILYGSVARGTQTKDSDVDIMVLIEGTDEELRRYEEKLGDVSTDLALKYLRVFSIIDVKYQEYMEWRTISPFYKNVDKEGVVVYAA